MPNFNRVKESKRKHKGVKIHRYDRSLLPWGDVPGPWQEEPDFARFTHAGLPVVVWRHPEMGVLNGYVGLPAGHDLHGTPREDLYIDFKYAINFSSSGSQIFMLKNEEKNAFEWQDGSFWWFGFDTVKIDHTMPLTAGMQHMLKAPWQTHYIGFKETTELAFQLAALLSTFKDDEEIDLDDILANFEWYDD